MKRFLPLLSVLGLLALLGCTDADAPDDEASGPNAAAAPSEYVAYGDPLPGGEEIVALTPAALTQDLGTYQNTVVRVEGTVAQVCRMQGCWLTLENPTATPIRVQVPRDSAGYVFTFPTDLGAAEVIIEGMVSADTTSVETLRHFAEDEGRPQAEIDAITEPQRTVILTARGALVKRPDVAAQS